MFAEESINQDAYMVFAALLVLLWGSWAGWLGLQRLTAAAAPRTVLEEPRSHVSALTIVVEPFDWINYNDLTPYDWRKNNG